MSDFDPALLLDWHGQDPTGWIVSEKFDGHRAKWTGCELLTRNGHTFSPPAWFTAGWPRQALDGELWAGHGGLFTVTGIVQRSAPDDWRRLCFMVFDAPETAGAVEDRIAAVRRLVSASPSRYLRSVKFSSCPDLLGLVARFRAIVRAGGEGIVIRRPQSAYTAGRFGDWLRLKPRNVPAAWC